MYMRMACTSATHTQLNLVKRGALSRGMTDHIPTTTIHLGGPDHKSGSHAPQPQCPTRRFSCCAGRLQKLQASKKLKKAAKKIMALQQLGALKSQASGLNVAAVQVKRSP